MNPARRTMTRKPGPKVDPKLGELRRVSLYLDDLTVRQFEALGGGRNVSNGARRAARIAIVATQFVEGPEVTPGSSNG